MIFIFIYAADKNKKKKMTRVGFEPTRVNHIRMQARVRSQTKFET